jgi:hypothetical protein
MRSPFRNDAQQAIRHGPSTAALRVAVSGRSIAALAVRETMSANLDQLAFRFFKLFARFEATLKEREFYRVENGRIVVDWDRFANEVVGKHFLVDLGDKAASATYILGSSDFCVGPLGTIDYQWERLAGFIASCLGC